MGRQLKRDIFLEKDGYVDDVAAAKSFRKAIIPFNAHSTLIDWDAAEVAMIYWNLRLRDVDESNNEWVLYLNSYLTCVRRETYAFVNLRMALIYVAKLDLRRARQYERLGRPTKPSLELWYYGMTIRSLTEADLSQNQWRIYQILGVGRCLALIEDNTSSWPFLRFWAMRNIFRERRIVDSIGMVARTSDADTACSRKADAFDRCIQDMVNNVHLNTDTRTMENIQEDADFDAAREDKAQIACEKYQIPALRM